MNQKSIQRSWKQIHNTKNNTIPFPLFGGLLLSYAYRCICQLYVDPICFGYIQIKPNVHNIQRHTHTYKYTHTHALTYRRPRVPGGTFLYFGVFLFRLEINSKDRAAFFCNFDLRWSISIHFGWDFVYPQLSNIPERIPMVSRPRSIPEVASKYPKWQVFKNQKWYWKFHKE